jgi:hypothetical protein
MQQEAFPYEVVVRNNDTGSSYRVLMDMPEEEARALEKFGVRLTEESDWSLTMTVVLRERAGSPVPPGDMRC